MKFNFKEIISAVAIVCLFFAIYGVIAMDSNFKDVPSKSDTSVSIDSNDANADTEDTENITVEKEENDIVTSTSPETEEDETEEDEKVEGPQLTPEEQEWQNYLMAQVEIGLNIRSEANVESEVLGRLRKGDRATIIEIGSEWTKIKSGKVEGYVNNAFCLFGTDALNLAKSVCDTIAVCTTDSLRVREAMNTDSEMVGVMEHGEALIVDTDATTKEGWVAVLYEGNTCYVSADYVTVSMNTGEAITMEEVYAIEEEKEEEERRKQEEAARQEAIKKAQSNKAYAASVAELDLLAALIYCEANIEPYEAKLAVGAVVMNRLEKGTYGSTLVDVIYQPEQFTPALNGLVNSALKNGKVNESCYQAAREALAGVDNTKGAMYFNDWHPELEGAGVMYGNMVFYYKWVPH